MSYDLTTGAHKVEVVQSSTGATVQSHVLGTTITLLPNTVIEVATDGSAATTQTIALTGGTYSRDELAAHIAAVSGGTLRAGFTNDGRLELSTTREGSAARLAVTGGTAIAALGLDVSGAASTGTDGIVKVDDIATTVSDLAPGGSATLAAGGGASLSATFQSGLRVGTVKAMNVDLGDGQLSTVATAINSAAAGLRATTVQVSPGTYRLQLAATASGLAGRMTADTSVFDTAFGGMSILSAAQDSKLTVGTGAASFSVSSSDNRVETLPGVIISLNKADPLTDVTITVSNDADAIASKVGAMIDSVNGTLSFIASQSRYDASTKTGGPLLSDSTARSMQSRLYDVFGTIGAKAASFGITLGKDATIQFDRAKFVAAYQLNPSSAQTAFTAPTVGIATRLADVGTKATESVTGILSSAITGKQTLSKSFTNQIASWDTRLTLRENGLRRTFSNLEVTLGKLKSQSAWLAGQITSLRTFK